MTINTTRLRNRIERYEAQMASDPTMPCPYCKVTPEFLDSKWRLEIAHRVDCGYIANLEALAVL